MSSVFPDKVTLFLSPAWCGAWRVVRGGWRTPQHEPIYEGETGVVEMLDRIPTHASFAVTCFLGGGFAQLHTVPKPEAKLRESEELRFAESLLQASLGVTSDRWQVALDRRSVPQAFIAGLARREPLEKMRRWASATRSRIVSIRSAPARLLELETNRNSTPLSRLKIVEDDQITTFDLSDGFQGASTAPVMPRGPSPLALAEPDERQRVLAFRTLVADGNSKQDDVGADPIDGLYIPWEFGPR